MVEVKTVPMTSLHQDPSNVRKHSEANIRAIAKSLEVFGQRKPLVVQGSRIVAGNGTFEAALSLGWEAISVADVPAEWDEAMVRAYAIADNQTALLAEWDDLLLAEQIKDLDATGWNVADLGFESSKKINEQDFIPVADEQPRLDQRNPTICPSCGFEWRVGAKGSLEEL